MRTYFNAYSCAFRMNIYLYMLSYRPFFLSTVNPHISCTIHLVFGEKALFDATCLDSILMCVLLCTHPFFHEKTSFYLSEKSTHIFLFPYLFVFLVVTLETHTPFTHSFTRHPYKFINIRLIGIITSQLSL